MSDEIIEEKPVEETKKTEVDNAPKEETKTEAETEAKGILDTEVKEEKKPGEEGEKKVSEEGKDKEPEKKEEKESKVPDAYELKLPDDSPLDDGAVERIAAIARERGLSNEEAQSLLESENQAVDDVLSERSEKWYTDIKNDKELGGDNFNETIALSKRALDKFGNDGFRSALKKSRLYNEPNLVRFMRDVGASMADDKNDAKPTQGSKPKTDAEVMYGTNE